jgi:phage-related protein
MGRRLRTGGASDGNTIPRRGHSSPAAVQDRSIHAWANPRHGSFNGCLTNRRIVLELARMADRTLKPVLWIGSCRDDLCRLSEAVQDEIGYALYFAQQNRRHPSARVLKGFGGAGVLEIIEDATGGTYRAVYTIKFAGVVYVLHVFQKKSKRGIATPKSDIVLIRRRLAVAESHFREHRHEYQSRQEAEADEE